MGALFSSLGGSLSSILSYFTAGRNYKLLILGLDNAGKTTALYKLSLGEVVLTQPTVGSNVETIQHENVRFEAWDLGGQTGMRSVWGTYYRSTDAVILMVDSTDRARIALAKEELNRLLGHEELNRAALLVLANKQDLKDAMTAAEISESLGLHHVTSHNWHLQACCALTGEGLYEGLGWIAQQVKLAATPSIAMPA